MVTPSPSKMTEKYIERALAKLDIGTHKQKFNILVEIRTKVTKSKNGVAFLIKHGVVPKLLTILSSDDSDKLSTKLYDIALSIMGNLCMEEQVRTAVLTHDGITVVGKILCENNQESIQNRSCRTLANLSLSPDCCTTIHKSDIVPRIVELLQNTSCKENKLTYCRAVRLLGKTAAEIDKLVSHHAVRAVAILLKEEETELQSAALRTVYEFSSSWCSAGFASQVSSAGVISYLVQWISHTDNTISNQSLKTLFKLLEHSHIRSSFGAAGGITLFLKTIQEGDNIDKVNKFSALNVLCMCCKEVVNRVKIRESGALELFLSYLQQEEWHCLHDRIISALQCFMYDDESFDVLLSNGMVPILTKHLKRVAKFETSIPKSHANCRTDDENVTVDLNTEKTSNESLENLEDEICTSKSKNVIEKEVYDKDTDKQSSEHVYSIDSPTYQPTVHWQDYSSGMKCKQFFETNATSPLSITSSQSPLSTISYYSPTSSSDYSPCHSPLHSGTSAGVNNNPNYPFVCSVPYAYDSPEKQERASLGGMSPLENKKQDNESTFEFLYSGSEDENEEAEQVEKDDTVTVKKLFANELDGSNKAVGGHDCTLESLKNIVLVNSLEDETRLEKEKSVLFKNSCNSPAHSKTDSQSGKESLNLRNTDKELNESENLEKPQPSRKNKVYPSDDESAENDETYQPPKRRKTRKMQRNCSNRTEGHILMILARISQMQCSNKYLTKQEIVSCLLDYITIDKAESRAVRLLSRVVRNPLCFESFLKINLPLMVYEKLLSTEDDDESWTSFMKNGSIQRKHERRRSVSSDDSSFYTEGCLTDSLDTSGSDIDDMAGKGVSMEAIAGMTLLQDFCLMAETPFGRGVVGHLLAKGDKQDNFNISLLYICWNRSMWQHYFFKLNILEKLLTTLQQGPDEDPFFNDVLQGFCVLGKLTDINLRLKVIDLKRLMQRSSVNIDTDCFCSTDDAHEDMVSFVMEDGSFVNANREILSAASPLFAAMLQGHYSESKQKEIALKDTSFFCCKIHCPLSPWLSCWM